MDKDVRLVFVPMFGDSFFTHWKSITIIVCSFSCFRPHVWGFFFHGVKNMRKNKITLEVFVPMFGDSFFTAECKNGRHYDGAVFVPMFGDSFFTVGQATFSPSSMQFSSPCLGILFSRAYYGYRKIGFYGEVFVPMFGDSFFTAYLW